MLTTLSTVKTRLAIDPLDTTSDSLLTNAIRAVSARFDKECNRTFARTVAATEEFNASETEILLACYPIEAVTKFELKSNETGGWVEQIGIDFLIRSSCIISLGAPLFLSYPSSISCLPSPVARATYTGGYVLPGASPGPGQLPLPDDLEEAAVEQVAAWFQLRDKLGLKNIWPYHGTYQALAQIDLLLPVKAVLQRHERWSI